MFLKALHDRLSKLGPKYCFNLQTLFQTLFQIYSCVRKTMSEYVVYGNHIVVYGNQILVYGKHIVVYDFSNIYHIVVHGKHIVEKRILNIISNNILNKYECFGGIILRNHHRGSCEHLTYNGLLLLYAFFPLVLCVSVKIWYCTLHSIFSLVLISAMSIQLFLVIIIIIIIIPHDDQFLPYIILPDVIAIVYLWSIPCGFENHHDRTIVNLSEPL